jgi:hypothetical protein
VERMYLTGDYAKGKDTGIIDLVFIGDVDKEYLLKMITKAEKMIGRKVRFISYSAAEWEPEALNRNGDKGKYLLLWEK